MAENFEFDALVKKREDLERLMMRKPDMEKKVQKIIRKVLTSARTEVSNLAQGSMKSDPRKAYNAVKSSVYKQILGGNISILDRRKATGGVSGYEPPRKLKPFQRGGNRVPRSAHTQQMMDYYGADRAFVLRFLNAGTQNRTAGTKDGKLHGNRGSISARNWFSSSSMSAIKKAVAELEVLIDKTIKEEFN